MRIVIEFAFSKGDEITGVLLYGPDRKRRCGQSQNRVGCAREQRGPADSQVSQA